MKNTLNNRIPTLAIILGVVSMVLGTVTTGAIIYYVALKYW